MNRTQRSAEEIGAIALSQRIAEQATPEQVAAVVDAYRNGTTQQEIAQIVFKCPSEHIPVVRTAVSYILRQHCSEEELRALSSEHRREGAREKCREYGSPGFPASARPKAVAALGNRWWEPEWNAALIDVSHDPANLKANRRIIYEKVVAAMRSLFPHEEFTSRHCATQIYNLRKRIRDHWKKVEKNRNRLNEEQ